MQNFNLHRLDTKSNNKVQKTVIAIEKIKQLGKQKFGVKKETSTSVGDFVKHCLHFFTSVLEVNFTAKEFQNILYYIDDYFFNYEFI